MYKLKLILYQVDLDRYLDIPTNVNNQIAYFKSTSVAIMYLWESKSKSNWESEWESEWALPKESTTAPLSVSRYGMSTRHKVQTIHDVHISTQCMNVICKFDTC